MKTRIVSLVFAVIASVVWSCSPGDEVDPSVAPSERSVRLVTTADKSTVIDLRQMARNIKGVDLVGSGIAYPDYVNERYLRYKDCSANPSAFSFDVLHTNNSRTKVNVQLIRLDAAAGFTHAKISNKEVLVVNLLNNPELSGYDPYTDGKISVVTNKPGDINYNNSNVAISVSSCGKNISNVAMLTYAPPSGFVGQVRFKYYLSVNADIATKGSAACYSPDASDYFSSRDVVIDVTN